MLRERFEVRVHESEVKPADAEIATAAAGCSGIVSLVRDIIDAALIDRLPGLRAIANYGVGYDNIDVEAATARGILVTNTPDVLTDATADLTFALLLAVARRLGEGEAQRCWWVPTSPDRRSGWWASAASRQPSAAAPVASTCASCTPPATTISRQPRSVRDG
jgi:lactate dehydrogenase-like 2-hydroxyacid dehydrogenase